MAEDEKIQIECAHCGNSNLMQIPGTWSPLPMGDNGFIQGPAVPIVMMGCPRCGFLQMFSPQAVQPLPFPENEVKQENPEEENKA